MLIFCKESQEKASHSLARRLTGSLQSKFDLRTNTVAMRQNSVEIRRATIGSTALKRAEQE